MTVMEPSCMAKQEGDMTIGGGKGALVIIAGSSQDDLGHFFFPSVGVVRINSEGSTSFD